MSEEKCEIIDHIEPDNSQDNRVDFKSRVPKDLMVVFGVIFTLVGISAFYSAYLDFSSVLETMVVFNLSVNEIDWLKVISREFLSIIPGVILLIGGIGLIRGSKTGWIFGLSWSLFVTISPVLMGLKILIFPSVQLDSFGGIIVALYLIFVVIGIVLISKPIRKYFAPNERDHRRVGIITLILIINFSAMNLFY